MQAFYRDNTVNIMAGSNVDIRNTLDAGLYKIVIEPNKAPYLVQVSDFVLPEKFYGKNNSRADFILSKYNTLKIGNLGALFVGAKGTGKTLLAKTICVNAAKQNIPTILIDSAVNPEVISDMIGKIDHKCIILFDEFEKNYTTRYDCDSNEGMTQTNLLSMLDGNHINNKLFLFTANDRYRVSEFLINRPSRIRYYIEFNGLTDEEISEYCDQTLINKDLQKRIIRLAKNIYNFSYDQMVSLVSELNSTSEEYIDEVFDIFNLKSDGNKLDSIYTVSEVEIPSTMKLSTGVTKNNIKDKLFVEFNRDGNICIFSRTNIFAEEYLVYGDEAKNPDQRMLDKEVHMYFDGNRVQSTLDSNEFILSDRVTGLKVKIKRNEAITPYSKLDFNVF